jgi:hypothetical protein
VSTARRTTAEGALVPGHDVRSCGEACACGVEVGHEFVAAALAVSGTARGAVVGASIAAAAVVSETAQGAVAGAAIAAAVGEGTGAEPSRGAAVAVGHTGASPRWALVPPAGPMRHRKRLERP